MLPLYMHITVGLIKTHSRNESKRMFSIHISHVDQHSGYVQNVTGYHEMGRSASNDNDVIRGNIRPVFTWGQELAPEAIAASHSLITPTQSRIVLHVVHLFK